jgi:hypothetical protein
MLDGRRNGRGEGREERGETQTGPKPVTDPHRQTGLGWQRSDWPRNAGQTSVVGPRTTRADSTPRRRMAHSRSASVLTRIST